MEKLLKLNKYILSIFFPILLFSLNIFSQAFSGGLMIGPTINWMGMDSKSVEKAGNRLSYSWGAFLDKNLSGNFALSTGIFINQFGGTVKYKEPIMFEYEDNTRILLQNTEIFYKYRYIETPISIKGMTNEIGYMKYHLKLGLSPMFKWKAKADIDPAPVVGESTNDVNVSNESPIFAMSFHVGGGAAYSLGGNTALIGEITFYNGITDITNEEHNDKNYTIFAHMLVFRVGIKF